MKQKLRVAIACGGTGGHIFPGLATAEILRERGHEVTLWLAGGDVETVSVSGWPGAIERVRAGGFPAGISLRSFVNALRMLRAVIVCWRRMRIARPDVVLAMGSYASVGPVLAARLLGVPVVLHEANAIPGRAISMLSRFAGMVALAFGNAADFLPGARTENVGFPLRRAFGKEGAALAVEAGRPTLLLMGGSQGAHILNECGFQAVKRLHDSGRALNVIHLAGKRDAEAVEQAYQQAGIPAQVYGFLRDMPAAYRAADLAVSRAGAASCAELAASAVPAILVPLPSARRDHQTANARQLELCGGIRLLPQSEMTPESLAELIGRALADVDALQRMRQALWQWGKGDATVRLADLVERQAGA